MLPSSLGLVRKVEQGGRLRVLSSGVTHLEVVPRRDAVQDGLLAAGAEVGVHAATSTGVGIARPATAAMMCMAISGGTALPICSNCLVFVPCHG